MIDGWALFVGVAGGLAIFLFGMERMTESLKALAGDGMRNVLGRLTTNRFTAALTGAVVTAVIQSSSVTTVIVVGFISAGLMTLGQSVGVIMGANVGTTITAQVIAFKVTEYALLLVALGFFATFVSKRPVLRLLGTMVLGLGMIFLGMERMADATNPLRTHAPFIEFMGQMQSPVLGMLVGALFTAIVQSSSATTGIVIVLASQGFIELEAGIALALGANVGTCATALLAALGKPRVAKQAALVHVLFNLLGALLWVGLIPWLAEFVRMLSDGPAGLVGTERLAVEVPRQIANAHTVFNLASALLFLGFTTPIARLVAWLLPVRDEPEVSVVTPEYLDDVYLEMPALALDRVGLEVGRLGALTVRMLRRVVHDRGVLVEENLDEIAQLHAAILDYMRKIGAGVVEPDVQARRDLMLDSVNQLAAIPDVIRTSYAALDSEWRSQNLHASDETRRRFEDLGARVIALVDEAVAAVRDADREAARQVIEAKSEVAQLADELLRHLGSRLAGADREQLAKYRLETAIVEILRRIYYFSKRMAKNVAADVHEASEPVPSP